MKALSFIFIVYILLDFQRRVREKDKFVTQKKFAEYTAGQATVNKDVEKRLAALESSSFA